MLLTCAASCDKSITLWIMFNGPVCCWKLQHLKLLTLWWMSFREASGIILGHVSLWLVQVTSLSHTGYSIFPVLAMQPQLYCPSMCFALYFFFHFYIMDYWVNIAVIALGRRVRNSRKPTTCECFKGIQEVWERKLGQGKRWRML